MKKRNYWVFFAVLLFVVVMTFPANATDDQEFQCAYFNEPFPDLSVECPSTVGFSVQLMSEEDAYADLKQQIAEEISNAYHNNKTADVYFPNTTSDTLTINQIQKIIINTLCDYPEKTYFARTNFAIYYNLDDSTFEPGKTIHIALEYYDVDDEQYAACVDAACIECFGGVSENDMTAMTDVEKIIVAHDWLVSNCQYDPYVHNNKVDFTTPGGLVYTENNNVYSSYGALVEHNAVCQGYALAFKVLMDRAGIDCCYVSSQKMGHAWNMVELDGSWYHVDVTWDDPIYTNWNSEVAGRVCRDNLLLNDDAITEEGHSNWSTEFGYLCLMEYTIPAAIANSSVAVYLYDSVLFVAYLDELVSYRANTDFATEVSSVELPGIPFTAAFSYVENALYFTVGYSTVYCADLKVNPVRIFTLGNSANSDVGLVIRENESLPGTYVLYEYYCYDVVGEWSIGFQQTDSEMPVIIQYPIAGLMLDELNDMKMAVKTEEDNYTVFFICFDSAGKMLDLHMLRVEENLITLNQSDVVSGTETAKIVVLSELGIPLSSQILIVNSLTK